MKKCLFISAFLMYCTFNAFSMSIGYWNWRHDDGNEVLATYYGEAPYGNMDTISITDRSNIRLRMEVLAPSDYGETTYLYYKLDDATDTLWHRVTNDASETFVYSLSENIINGEPTTEQLPNTEETTYTNVAGVVLENTATGFNLMMNTDERKELEFCIKPSSSAVFDNKRYLFSLNNADTSAFWTLGMTLPAIILQKPSAVSETETERLTIYPNPASSYINLKGQIPDGAMVEIYDLTGKAILKQPLTNSTINIRSLNNGNYILKINDSVYRFTKQ